MITKEDFETLDDRYVKKDDCNDRHADTTKQISDMSIQMTKISTQLGIIIKIISVIGGTVGTAIVGGIVGLILK